MIWIAIIITALVIVDTVCLLRTWKPGYIETREHPSTKCELYEKADMCELAEVLCGLEGSSMAMIWAEHAEMLREQARVTPAYYPGCRPWPGEE